MILFNYSKIKRSINKTVLRNMLKNGLHICWLLQSTYLIFTIVLKNLSHTYVTVAIDFIINYKFQFVNLRASSTAFVADEIQYNTYTTTRFTTLMACKSTYRHLLDFYDVAEDLYYCVCNSAGFERIFSTLRVTYGELRRNFLVE